MIEFLDGIMGSGKSTWAINHINSNPDKRFVVACLILKECDRYETACSMYQPQGQYGSKMKEFIDAVRRGDSVVITHSLLLDIDVITLNMIKELGYDLILDEVISNFIYVCAADKHTIKVLERSKTIKVHGDKKIEWLDEDIEVSSEIKEATLKGRAYAIGNFAVAYQSPDIYDYFANTTIMTYMASSSLMYMYFKATGRQISVRHMQTNIIPNHYKHLITIDSRSNANSFENKLRKLSSSGMSKMNKRDYAILSKYVNSFFHNKGYTRGIKLWTTYKSNSQNLLICATKFDMLDFLQHSSKATNNYSKTHILAYVMDKHLNPGIIKLLSHLGYKLSKKQKDDYALSEMLQWIWRSRIRNNKSIDIYIPSKRMRDMLINWLI